MPWWIKCHISFNRWSHHQICCLMSKFMCPNDKILHFIHHGAPPLCSAPSEWNAIFHSAGGAAIRCVAYSVHLHVKLLVCNDYNWCLQNVPTQHPLFTFSWSPNIQYALIISCYISRSKLSFWPTVLSVEPMVQCVVCRLSVCRLWRFVLWQNGAS